MCEAGSVVLAKSGRDAGRYFLVIALDGAELLLADGKHRTLSHPKRKNPLHVQATGQHVPPEGLTDKAIRDILHPLNYAQPVQKSKRNQIR